MYHAKEFGLLKMNLQKNLFWKFVRGLLNFISQVELNKETEKSALGGQFLIIRMECPHRHRDLTVDPWGCTDCD